MAPILAMTGGTGFVGRHTLAEALRRGHRVRALARRPQPPLAGVEWIAGDLADTAALARLVDGADAAIHIAGVLNARSAALYSEGNVRGTANLCAALGGRPLVHVSSLAARRPDLSTYGRTKRDGEEIALACPGRVVALRPPAVYGPGDREFLALVQVAKSGLLPVPRRARAAMLYGPDLAAALVSLSDDLLAAGKSAGKVLEIDDGHGGYDGAELAAALSAALHRRVRPLAVPPALLFLIAAGDTALSRLAGRLPKLGFDRARYMAHPDWTADSSALRALGLWQPHTLLAEGLAATVAALAPEVQAPDGA